MDTQITSLVVFGGRGGRRIVPSRTRGTCAGNLNLKHPGRCIKYNNSKVLIVNYHIQCLRITCKIHPIISLGSVAFPAHLDADHAKRHLLPKCVSDTTPNLIVWSPCQSNTCSFSSLGAILCILTRSPLRVMMYPASRKSSTVASSTLVLIPNVSQTLLTPSSLPSRFLSRAN